MSHGFYLTNAFGTGWSPVVPKPWIRVPAVVEAPWQVARAELLDPGVRTAFGSAGDKPAAADYDGDGKADLAVFRPNGSTGTEWWLLRSTAGLIAYQFGTATDKAVYADYSGDGKADVAFWRPSSGEWFVLRSEDSTYYAFPFGSSTDIPVTGDYDGDGKSDAGVYRPSSGTWYVQRSTAGTLIQGFGTTGDQPVPNAFVR